AHPRFEIASKTPPKTTKRPLPAREWALSDGGLVCASFVLCGFRAELGHLFSGSDKRVLGGKHAVHCDLERLRQLVIVKPSEVGKFAFGANNELVFVFGNYRTRTEGDGVDLTGGQKQPSLSIANGRISAHVSPNSDDRRQHGKHNV